ncbi:hypothetical protein EVJ58_g6920 [Rhodofomes roseus]|uniref:Reverse transcriptase domain-containing protein n=1 Tax=Rhodofomes roseus TaxID=34475 RepID=A0A4Y9Y760_9APHY|nr:hypothetical protein EVJ58_g6920 [Rhodofomes roseus]
MADVVMTYHNNIQEVDPPGFTLAKQQAAIQVVLQDIEVNIDYQEKQLLSANATKDDVKDALKKTKTGKAAGIDGIPYEFWTAFMGDADEEAQTDEDDFDIIKYLTMVFNDIETHGKLPDSRFADGWLCPIYKKGDKRKIENYRPITLLNTDYKIYTRILTSKLGTIATTLIHEDQAGFVPNRHIENQTQTCRVLVDYAEALDEDGVIVALDQEKAYDKIDHTYLWQALEALGLPPRFIQKVKNLYSNAQTTVIVNGERSHFFTVTRGVRQGDPLSCLLFDLAIEPLAIALRRSEIAGFHIPGTAERLVASLFADDTSSFLSKSDNWTSLWNVLGQWCTASRAKFNDGKTEVIPIGSSTYRRAVYESRRIDPSDQDSPQIPPQVHIAPDGEPVRVLGAWIGNNIDQVSIWAPAMHKIRSFLDRWNRCRPSMFGKRHIVQMGPGGISQYLTVVQGMPSSVETDLVKMIRVFMWGSDSPPPIGMDTLCRPISEGGLGLLDIKARNEAINLMWIKRYLTLTPDRPKWAYAMDAILAKHVTKNTGAIDKKAQVNTFLQSWTPAYAARSQLPRYMKEMLNIGKKYGVQLEALKSSETPQ